MLEKPDLQDQPIISRLQDSFGLLVNHLTFLPLGADFNTAVYRAVAEDGTAYFLKLRKGDFDEITVAVPLFLKDQGLQSIISRAREGGRIGRTTDANETKPPCDAGFPGDGDEGDEIPDENTGTE